MVRGGGGGADASGGVRWSCVRGCCAADVPVDVVVAPARAAAAAHAREHLRGPPPAAAAHLRDSLEDGAGVREAAGADVRKEYREGDGSTTARRAALAAAEVLAGCADPFNFSSESGEEGSGGGGGGGDDEDARRGSFDDAVAGDGPLLLGRDGSSDELDDARLLGADETMRGGGAGGLSVIPELSFEVRASDSRAPARPAHRAWGWARKQGTPGGRDTRASRSSRAFGRVGASASVPVMERDSLAVMERDSLAVMERDSLAVSGIDALVQHAAAAARAAPDPSAAPERRLAAAVHSDFADDSDEAADAAVLVAAAAASPAGAGGGRAALSPISAALSVVPSRAPRTRSSQRAAGGDRDSPARAPAPLPVEVDRDMGAGFAWLADPDALSAMSSGVCAPARRCHLSGYTSGGAGGGSAGGGGRARGYVRRGVDGYEAGARRVLLRAASTAAVKFARAFSYLKCVMCGAHARRRQRFGGRRGGRARGGDGHRRRARARRGAVRVAAAAPSVWACCRGSEALGRRERHLWRRRRRRR